LSAESAPRGVKFLTWKNWTNWGIAWELKRIFFYLSKRITGKDKRKFIPESLKKVLRGTIEN
jgi:hypothetical protein